MQQGSIHVLLVDDDEDYYFVTGDLLSDVEELSYKVDWLPNFAKALEALKSESYDVCLVDYQMGKLNGLEFVRAAIEEAIDVPLILLTGQGDRKVDLEAMNLGAADYLNKGEITAQNLERSIRYAIERSRHLRQLRDYAADLETKNRELDAYTHTIAHDLTNPLGTVSNFARLILMTDGEHLSEDSHEMLTTIQSQVLKMSDMVTQLLWLAKVRDASNYIHYMELEPIVKSAISRFDEQIKEQGVYIMIESDMPMAYGQAIWVEEVFANLISNALKYMRPDNSKPQITIRGYENDGMAIYEVEDNGIGIAPHDQSQLFEMFRRIHNKDTEDIQGSGLGLSIVQRIVSKLGGEVGVQSTFNQGSTFWFSLRTTEDQIIDITFE